MYAALLSLIRENRGLPARLGRRTRLLLLDNGTLVSLPCSNISRD